MVVVMPCCILMDAHVQGGQTPNSSAQYLCPHLSTPPYDHFGRWHRNITYGSFFSSFHLPNQECLLWAPAPIKYCAFTEDPDTSIAGLSNHDLACKHMVMLQQHRTFQHTYDEFSVSLLTSTQDSEVRWEHLGAVQKTTQKILESNY